MNPTAGSFTINPRLQNHFSTFTVSFPSEDSLKSIYRKILKGHFMSGSFNNAIQSITESVINLAMSLHSHILKHPSFQASAIRFHYQFNLREISAVCATLLWLLMLVGFWRIAYD